MRVLNSNQALTINSGISLHFITQEIEQMWHFGTFLCELSSYLLFSRLWIKGFHCHTGVQHPANLTFLNIFMWNICIFVVQQASIRGFHCQRGSTPSEFDILEHFYVNYLDICCSAGCELKVFIANWGSTPYEFDIFEHFMWNISIFVDQWLVN